MAKQQKRTSIKDVASKAGVSTTLVSFVLNEKAEQHRVSEKTVAHIREIAKELNYKPNTVAKSLRDGRSRVIGVVVSDIANPFFAQLARNIEKTAEKSGYTVQFSSSDEDADRCNTLINEMINRSVDSLIVVPCDGMHAAIRKLALREPPLVLLDRYLPDISTNYVCLNNRLATFKATQHLIDEGYERIGLIAYDTQLQHMADRIEGYRSAMTDNGLSHFIQVEFVRHSEMRETSIAALDAMLDAGIEALLFSTNTITIECLHEINRRKIRIPDELGLVGFDGSDAFAFFYSPLTYIQQPLEMMAQKAVEMSIRQLGPERDLMQHIEANGTLIVRQSSLRKSKGKSGGGFRTASTIADSLYANFLPYSEE